jgi:hypothetical protein
MCDVVHCLAGLRLTHYCTPEGGCGCGSHEESRRRSAPAKGYHHAVGFFRRCLMAVGRVTAFDRLIVHGTLLIVTRVAENMLHSHCGRLAQSCRCVSSIDAFRAWAGIQVGTTLDQVCGLCTWRRPKTNGGPGRIQGVYVFYSSGVAVSLGSLHRVCIVQVGRLLYQAVVWLYAPNS